MRKILGLDLGTTSIGWAYVNEAENSKEKSSIQKLGVRVIPVSTDEETDFLKGKATSINADRTLKRGARRNLDRFQQRRKALIEILRSNHIIDKETSLGENGKDSTFSLYKVRAKAAKEKVSLEDLARILLMINKKRGYKSSRKASSEEEGKAIDGMDVAKELLETGQTPGQYVYQLLKSNKKPVPDFYRSDLQDEFEKVWQFQSRHYPEILTPEFKEQLTGKGKRFTLGVFIGSYQVYAAENRGKRDEVKLQAYKWRSEAVDKQLSIEEVAYVLGEINNNISNSSGYLGAISDRSKELYFNKQTVGEYLYSQLKHNRHTRLKNQVFYRNDYLNEFETILEEQAKHHQVLTEKLKDEIRDIIIFYQRRLKSQKHLISDCEFEKYHKAIPKSSPLFQEFKIWQILNNLQIRNNRSREESDLDIEQKEILFNELNITEKLPDKTILKLITIHPKDYTLNYKVVEGNRTNAALYKAWQKIMEYEGENVDLSKIRADDVNERVSTFFLEHKIDTSLLFFNPEIAGNDYDKQSILQLWHLLYSAEDDEKLVISIVQKLGLSKEYSGIIAQTRLQDGYGSLSSKAIRKILPHLKDGFRYDDACSMAGYNHSSSLTAEERQNRELKDKLELLPKNSLRNPVVEKILNQMVNVINAIIEDNDLGKPDEIRIELARELKSSADERKRMTDGINKATRDHQEYRKILQVDFGIPKVTRNDIIRYKLYLELEANGFKTLYTNTYIPKEKLFSKEFDIEHIIPKARLFDDSFSNKTLSVRQINIDKGNETAWDYLKTKLNDNEFNQYLARIEKMFDKGKGSIRKAKYDKLLMEGENIPEGFIERDLRNSQYIAKKAKQILEEVVREVNTTSGKITSRLREDWQLINLMKELNLPKYRTLGMVATIEGKNGQQEEQIKDWSKRNDHRHHAMDALTVAFTNKAIVQYLNNLNARSDKSGIIYGIEQKYLDRDKNNKLLFKPPIPLNQFRNESKKHLESILISFKAKNKVVTRNKNKIKLKGKDSFKEQITLTPRGQLHKETVYGRISRYVTKEEKIGAGFDLEKIELVANKLYRNALKKRLQEYENDPKKAFGGKNSLSKNPVFLDELRTKKLPEKVKMVRKGYQYTIRKEIEPGLKIEKIIDVGIRKLLEKRLKEFDGDPKKAFSNLEENPVWLNKEKGITIKRVTISGVNNVEALHFKKNHMGEFIYDEKGDKQAVDFVSTGNNHHVAIYRDEKGNLQDEVVSFYEAVHRINAGLPVINKTHEKGWEFLFTMKQNEYFVFPSGDFNPEDIDLLDTENAGLISPNLYRVQKFSKLEYGNSVVREYVFRHHLETIINDAKSLKEVSFKVAKSLARLNGIIKVRINHLGQIVKVGE